MLRNDRGGFVALDRTLLENLAEGIDPLAFDPVGQHSVSLREANQQPRANEIESCVEGRAPSSAVDLKFLSDVRQGPYRNFKSKTALETYTC